LWVDGDLDHQLFAWLAAQMPVSCFRQQGRDLGDRMLGAARQVLRTNAGVIFIGSDCPFLDPAYLYQATLALRDNDAVIGPATDGGYVLLGIRDPQPALFTNMPWGTDAILELTEQRLQRLNWSWARLPPLADIDRPDDLLLLDRPDLPPELRHFAQFA
jgi:rSAM/selenodomain-associated transferase 1